MEWGRIHQVTGEIKQIGWAQLEGESGQGSLWVFGHKLLVTAEQDSCSAALSHNIFTTSSTCFTHSFLMFFHPNPTRGRGSFSSGVYGGKLLAPDLWAALWQRTSVCNHQAVITHASGFLSVPLSPRWHCSACQPAVHSAAGPHNQHGARAGWGGQGRVYGRGEKSED